MLRSAPDAGCGAVCAVEPSAARGAQQQQQQELAPFVRGVTINFPSSDSSAALAAHVDLSRTRVLKAYLAALQLLCA